MAVPFSDLSSATFTSRIEFVKEVSIQSKPFGNSYAAFFAPHPVRFSSIAISNILSLKADKEPPTKSSPLCLSSNSFAHIGITPPPLTLYTRQSGSPPWYPELSSWSAGWESATLRGWRRGVSLRIPWGEVPTNVPSKNGLHSKWVKGEFWESAPLTKSMIFSSLPRFFLIPASLSLSLRTSSSSYPHHRCPVPVLCSQPPTSRYPWIWNNVFPHARNS